MEGLESAPGGVYRVLARKYRPSTFADLIGQEAMVRTLSNAFSTGRVAQAYMLTGVRGVGKTTTARILARALNYSVPEMDAPSLEMPRLGEHCQAIMESRHVDVLEMDAASHTGIGDIREIIDGSRYRPIAARYRVYIIDEVHMLSTAAFNGLLKTLEEPPEHAKFIFATTEIRKVPVTVLSRCQRFDLRRVETERLVAHLREIAVKEDAQADDEALGLIARAAEGSVRDALSLLDQAIAHGAGRIEAEAVREMLGLADRARILDLFEHVMRGRVAPALAELRAQYDAGADPVLSVTDLGELVHLVTRLKLVPSAARDPGLTQAERERGLEFANALSVRTLSRAWSMLAKGLPEVQAADRPLAAAEMLLIRLAYAADLPTPDEALRALSGEPPPPRPAPRAEAQPAVDKAETNTEKLRISAFSDIVALAQERRDLKIKAHLERHVRPVGISPGELEIALVDGAPAGLPEELGRALSEWTGERWVVRVACQGGAPTLEEERRAEETRLMDELRADPAVAAVLERFPGSSILGVTASAPDPAFEIPETAEDIAEPEIGTDDWSPEPKDED